MNTSLLIQTAFETLEQLAEGFADRTTEDQRLMLYGPEPYPVNEDVQFAIYLADGTPGIEGVGRVAASLDGGEDRLPDARWDVVLDSLRLDEWALEALATMVAARRARDGVEVDDGGLDAVEVEVGGADAPPSLEPEPLVSDVDGLVESVRPTAPPADGAAAEEAGSELPMSDVESLPPDAPDSITAPPPAGDPDPAPPDSITAPPPAGDPDPAPPVAETPEPPMVELPVAELPVAEPPVAEPPEPPEVEPPELPVAEPPEPPVAETPERPAAPEPDPPAVEAPAAPSPPVAEPDRLLVRPTRAPEWTPTPPAPVPPRTSTGAFTYPPGALPAPDAAPRPPLHDDRRIGRAPRPVEGEA